MNMTEHTHPRTGHPCRKPKDSDLGPLPEDITIEIKRSRCFMEAGVEGTCNKGSKGCFVDHADPQEADTWYAELSGYVNMGDGRLKVWAQLTHGYSVADAAKNAAEVAQLCYEQCKEPGVPHCYCRDTTYSQPGAEDVTQVVQCCVCNTCMTAGAFETVDDEFHRPDPTSADVRQMIADAQPTPPELATVDPAEGDGN
jgi:hypothetical protein